MIESTATAQEHTYVRTDMSERLSMCACVLSSFVCSFSFFCLHLSLALSPFLWVDLFPRKFLCVRVLVCVCVCAYAQVWHRIHTSIWYVCVQINVLIKFNELFSSVSFHSNLKHFSFSYCHSFTQMNIILFSLSLLSSFCCCSCCCRCCYRC